MQVVYIFFILLLIEETYFAQAYSLISRYKRQTCGSDQFRCRNGQCVPTVAICDGETDCGDGTDETQTVCSRLNLRCPSFAFRCTYGACIDRGKVCNGKRDCADNSDELLRECPSSSTPVKDGSSSCKKGEFKCSSGQCIDEFALCDGVADCNDGSDETITQCVNIKCPPDFSFQCAYGACIDKVKKCNKVNDCSDGSDEDEDLCRSEKRPGTNIPKPTPPPPPVLPPTTGGCILPDFPEDGHYLIESCSVPGKCNNGPGSISPTSTIIKFECYKGFVLANDTSGGILYCKNGAWNPQPMRCLKQCKPLISDSMEFDCTYGGESVRCNQFLNPGTKIEPRCKTGYVKIHTSESYFETKCLEDGDLENPLFRCEAECGKHLKDSALTLISFGEKTEIGEYPWHAGLYLRGEEGYEHICGGTIINPHAILTAAHCIFIESTESVRDKDDLKVAVGKYTRSWAVKDKYEKRYDVREIIPQRYYRGMSNSYSQDIAVLDLTVTIELSELILPACLDWKGDRKFILEQLGTVVGWGLNENKVFTDTLEMAKLPYYDYDSCRSNSRREFHRFITYDKFCAGYKNGTSVQRGDSGGGLTFEINNQHFVYGVVSLKQKNSDSYAVFTNVTTHIRWLSDVLGALRPFHSK